MHYSRVVLSCSLIAASIASPLPIPANISAAVNATQCTPGYEIIDCKLLANLGKLPHVEPRKIPCVGENIKLPGCQNWAVYNQTKSPETLPVVLPYDPAGEHQHEEHDHEGHHRGEHQHEEHDHPSHLNSPPSFPWKPETEPGVNQTENVRLYQSSEYRVGPYHKATHQNATTLGSLKLETDQTIWNATDFADAVARSSVALEAEFPHHHHDPPPHASAAPYAPFPILPRSAEARKGKIPCGPDSPNKAPCDHSPHSYLNGTIHYAPILPREDEIKERDHLNKVRST